MKIKNLIQLNDFIGAIDKCKSQVWLEAPDGSKYCLNSEFSKYIALGKLLEERGDWLELFCASKDDEVHFLKYFHDHPEVQI